MSGAHPDFGLPRAARLLKRPDFENVYQNGQRSFFRHMSIFYLRREQGAPRVGFTVGRALGPAVARNRIRRRLREAVRLQLPQFGQPVDLIFHPKKSALTIAFPQLAEEVGRAFDAARNAKVWTA
jgi:ribonuclease P protein component